MRLHENEIIPIKANNFEKEFFDGVVITNSYNYFGRDEYYLDNKLLPYI